MALTLQLDRSGGLALYRQIAEQIKDRISDGRLPPGAQLPTVRRLAQEAGVTRLTVQNAYAELQSGGWIEATVGRGTFVSGSVRPSPPVQRMGGDLSPDAVLGEMMQFEQFAGVRSLASASPDPHLFPADEFWAVLGELRGEALSLTSYTPSQGDPKLRVQLSQWLAERGVDATAEEILVTSGAAQALALVVQALTRPGDTVAVEQPSYIGFLNILRVHGVQPAGVPMDAEGPRLDVLERIVLQQRPRFFYTIPNFHNPTGVSMSPTRRADLLALAARHGLLVVEDDIYARLAYDGPAPGALAALDRHGLVVHIGGFSKVLSPALRSGYVAAPPPLASRLLSLRRAADLCSPALMQRALAVFLAGGGLRRHLRRVLPVYRERRDAAVAALRRSMPPGVEWTEPAGGFCIWMTFPEGPAYRDLHRAALEQGWGLAPGEAFLAQPDAQRHLRVTFGHQSAETVRAGIEALGRLAHGRQAAPPRPTAELTDWLAIA